jgi:hypothetical protein
MPTGAGRSGALTVLIPKFGSTASPGQGSGLDVENLEAKNPPTAHHVRKSTEITCAPFLVRSLKNR